MRRTKDGWIEVKPGRWMRLCDKRTAQMFKVGSVKATVERNAEVKRATQGKPSFTETKGGMMQQIGQMPPDVALEMRDNYGQDEDAIKAFLRDNPQYLVTQKRNIRKMPSKKLYCFPR